MHVTESHLELSVHCGTLSKVYSSCKRLLECVHVKIQLWQAYRKDASFKLWTRCESLRQRINYKARYLKVVTSFYFKLGALYFSDLNYVVFWYL